MRSDWRLMIIRAQNRGNQRSAYHVHTSRHACNTVVVSTPESKTKIKNCTTGPCQRYIIIIYIPAGDNDVLVQARFTSRIKDILLLYSSRCIYLYLNS